MSFKLPDDVGAHPVTKARRPWCGLCFGRGYRRIGREYAPCTCGRLPNATGAYKIALQEEKKTRLAKLQAKGW